MKYILLILFLVINAEAFTQIYHPNIIQNEVNLLESKAIKKLRKSDCFYKNKKNIKLIKIMLGELNIPLNEYHDPLEITQELFKNGIKQSYRSYKCFLFRKEILDAEVYFLSSNNKLLANYYTGSLFCNNENIYKRTEDLLSYIMEKKYENLYQFYLLSSSYLYCTDENGTPLIINTDEKVNGEYKTIKISELPLK